MTSTESSDSTPPIKKHRNKELTLTEKVKVIEYLKTHTQSNAARHFNIGKSTVTRLKRLAPKYSSLNENRHNRIRQRHSYTSPYGQINAATKCWYQEMRTHNWKITGPQVQEIAARFAKRMGVTKFRASNGWLEGFLSRNEIQLKGDAGMVINLSQGIGVVNPMESVFEKVYNERCVQTDASTTLKEKNDTSLEKHVISESNDQNMMTDEVFNSIIDCNDVPEGGFEMFRNDDVGNDHVDLEEDDNICKVPDSFNINVENVQPVIARPERSLLEIEAIFQQLRTFAIGKCPQMLIHLSAAQNVFDQYICESLNIDPS